MSLNTFTTNLGCITDFGLRFRPDAPALLQDGLELTYRQLDERINRVANGLAAAGIQRQERVLVLWENDIRFIETVLGTIRAGAVAVPINPALTIEKHRVHLQDSEAKAILASQSVAANAAALAADDSVIFAAAVDGKSHGLADYEAWLAGCVAQRPDIINAPDDLAWLPYTSGSTGKPKGVKIAHQMLLRDAQLAVHASYIDSGDRVIVSAPLFHMNAAAVGLLPVLYAGGSAYVLPKFDAAAVLRGIEERRCTFTVGVPAMYKLMLAEKQELSRDFSTMRLICCGSAPMPPSLIGRLAEVFPRVSFVEGYGLTECGPIATLNPLVGPRRTGSIGRPLPGFEVKVVGDGDVEQPPGETGEIWLRNSTCTTLGYINRPDQDAKRLKPGGWFATGDLAMQDDDGWLYFRGRADDMMNVGGENVYPVEIEAVLARHPLVHDVAVVPVPHETKGEVPVAFVVLEKEASLAEDQLKQFFLQNGPAYAHPRQISFLPAMPLAATRKVDRNLLMSMALESQPRSAVSETS